MASPGIIRGVFAFDGELVGWRNEEWCLVHGVADQTLDTHNDPLLPHVRADLTKRGVLRDPASSVKFRHDGLSQLPARDRDANEDVQ